MRCGSLVLFGIFIFVFYEQRLVCGNEDLTQDADYQAAITHFQEEDYDAAIESFQRILKRYPDSAKIYNLVGMTYLRQKKSLKSAQGSFEQAIKLDPTYAEAYFNLASFYASEGGNPALAADYFQKTIDINPNFSQAYFGLGWFSLTEKHDTEKAMAYFLKTLELYPDFAEAYYGIGITHIQEGHAYLSLEAISKLRELNRQDLATLIERTMQGEIEEIKEEETGVLAKEDLEAGGAEGSEDYVWVGMRGKVAPAGESTK